MYIYMYVCICTTPREISTNKSNNNNDNTKGNPIAKGGGIKIYSWIEFVFVADIL